VAGRKKKCEEERRRLERAEEALERAAAWVAPYREDRDARRVSVAQAKEAVSSAEAKVRQAKEADVPGASNLETRGKRFVLVPGVGAVHIPDLEAELARRQAGLEAAEAALAAAQKALDDRLPRLESRIAARNEARRAYLRCIGKEESPAESPAPPPEEPGEEPAPEPKKCGEWFWRPVGEPQDLGTVVTGFRMRADVVDRPGAREGEQLADDLGLLGKVVDALGQAAGAGGLKREVFSSYRRLRTGKYVVGARGLARGGAKATNATDTLPVDVPTSLPEAAIRALGLVARSGGIIVGEATSWAKQHRTGNFSGELMGRQVTAQAYEGGQCEQLEGHEDPHSEWTRTRIWEITVGPERVIRRLSWERHFRIGAEVEDMGREMGTHIQEWTKEILESNRRFSEWQQSHGPQSRD
jgi:hypothetical protein